MPPVTSIFRKALAVLLLIFSTVVLATVVYCHHYQDQIIQKFLDEANKRLENPIQISSIRLASLETFPKVSLILQDVVVKKRTKPTADLLVARRVCVAFDMWKLVKGQYIVNRLFLEHGKLHLEEDITSQLGWRENEPGAAQTKAPLTVRLHKVEFADMEIAYGGKQQHYVIHAEHIQAKLKWRHARLKADLQGKAMILGIVSKDLVFAKNLPIHLKAVLRHHRQGKTWTLGPAQLKHSDSLLTLQGSWRPDDTNPIALEIKSQKISPQFLLLCLPDQYYKKIAPYAPQGQLALDLSISKQQDRSLSLHSNFVLREGALQFSQFSEPMALHQFSGCLRIPSVKELQTATLSVDTMTGTLGQSRLEGSFALSDFQNFQLQCTGDAMVDLTSLRRLLTHTTVTDASGRLEVHGKLEANLRALMLSNCTKDNIHLSGALQAKNVQFRPSQSHPLCKELNGELLFRDNIWDVKDFSGSIGPGNFTVHGVVHNLLPSMLSNSQKLYGEARLYIDYLDLDALLTGKHEASTQADTSPKFHISPQWVLNLDCDVQQLHFRRFQGKGVRGRLKIQDQKLIAEKLKLGMAGGKAFLDGVLDASTDQLNIHTAVRLKGVQLASLFYTFENFQQNFLMDRHLSGEVFSDFVLKLQTDKHWNVNWDALQADINARLTHGKLQQFEPIQRLAKYATKDSLTNLRFSALKNRIRIKSKKIHIPFMEVHSNVTRIQLSGTHTFDGKVDYSFVVPFTSFQQPGVDTLEEVDADALAGINLFLKLSGDVDNYRITYDTEALQDSLKGKLQEQGQALKDLLQGKYNGKVQLKELAPDDYFEFD